MVAFYSVVTVVSFTRTLDRPRRNSVAAVTRHVPDIVARTIAALAWWRRRKGRREFVATKGYVSYNRHTCSRGRKQEIEAGVNIVSFRFTKTGKM